MKFLSVQVFKSCSHFLSLRSKYLPQYPTIKYHQSMFLPSFNRKVSHPHKTTKLQYCIPYQMTKWKKHMKNIIKQRTHCSPKLEIEKKCICLWGWIQESKKCTGLKKEEAGRAPNTPLLLRVYNHYFRFSCGVPYHMLVIQMVSLPCHGSGDRVIYWFH
jgi:hypothetical protein